jgi:hypothetical protein
MTYKFFFWINILCLSFKAGEDPIAIYHLNFQTQYNQFYLYDKGSAGKTDSKNFWTQDAFADKLAMEKGILGVGIYSYGHVKGELCILMKPPQAIAYDRYDHIVEGGLEIKSGVLQVLDCPNSKVELEVKVKPGKYRVRIYSSNLAGGDMDEVEGKDYYKIEIWPDENMERKVLKRYSDKK